MRMQAVDQYGTLYSSGGVRFGGLPTNEFMDQTRELEDARPGAREEILGEADYFVRWQSAFPDICFLAGVVGSRSLLFGLLCFSAAYVAEIVRFYLFGPWRVLSQFCNLWLWFQPFVFIGCAVALWREGWTIPVALVVYQVVQGWGRVLSGFSMVLFRYPIAKLIDALFGTRDKGPHFHNLEGRTLQLVILRWQESIGACGH